MLNKKPKKKQGKKNWRKKESRKRQRTSFSHSIFTEGLTVTRLLIETWKKLITVARTERKTEREREDDAENNGVHWWVEAYLFSLLCQIIHYFIFIVIYSLSRVRPSLWCKRHDCTHSGHRSLLVLKSEKFSQQCRETKRTLGTTKGSMSWCVLVFASL